MEYEEQIICPVCGGHTWKLYKSTFSDGDCGLRIVCGTPGCRVDNMTMFNSKVETVWQVIEADKFMTFDDSLAKTQEVIKQLENQDMESIGFVPTLEFGVLFPEAMNNMIENRNIIKK